MKSIPGGTITSPRGFLAGATCAGLMSKGGLDLGMLYSELPCNAMGLFTTNKIKAATLSLCQQHLDSRRERAIVVNWGCANACTGERVINIARQMANSAVSLDRASAALITRRSLVRIQLPLPTEMY